VYSDVISNNRITNNNDDDDDYANRPSDAKEEVQRHWSDENNLLAECQTNPIDGKTDKAAELYLQLLTGCLA
jgi:hypothetical protein